MLENGLCLLEGTTASGRTQGLVRDTLRTLNNGGSVSLALGFVKHAQLPKLGVPLEITFPYRMGDSVLTLADFARARPLDSTQGMNPLPYGFDKLFLNGIRTFDVDPELFRVYGILFT